VISEQLYGVLYSLEQILQEQVIVNVAMVCVFNEKNYMGVVRIVHARSFTVLIETVHHSTAVVWEQNRNFLNHYCMPKPDCVL